METVALIKTISIPSMMTTKGNPKDYHITNEELIFNALNKLGTIVFTDDNVSGHMGSMIAMTSLLEAITSELKGNKADKVLDGLSESIEKYTIRLVELELKGDLNEEELREVQEIGDQVKMILESTKYWIQTSRDAVLKAVSNI